jgi:hypothetical protein
MWTAWSILRDCDGALQNPNLLWSHLSRFQIPRESESGRHVVQEVPDARLIPRTFQCTAIRQE